MGQLAAGVGAREWFASWTPTQAKQGGPAQKGGERTTGDSGGSSENENKEDFEFNKNKKGFEFNSGTAGTDEGRLPIELPRRPPTTDWLASWSHTKDSGSYGADSSSNTKQRMEDGEEDGEEVGEDDVEEEDLQDGGWGGDGGYTRQTDPSGPVGTTTPAAGRGFVFNSGDSSMENSKDSGFNENKESQGFAFNKGKKGSEVREALAAKLHPALATRAAIIKAIASTPEFRRSTGTMRGGSQYDERGSSNKGFEFNKNKKGFEFNSSGNKDKDEDTYKEGMDITSDVSKIPKGCIVWFDGCNVCTREGVCTQVGRCK
jgi:hypothetical protein